MRKLQKSSFILLVAILAPIVANAENLTINRKIGITDNSTSSANQGKKTTPNSYTDAMTGMEFIRVEGGCFQMGSNRAYKNEKPLHEVCVDGFYIGKYEVTQDNWLKVMGKNPPAFHTSRKPKNAMMPVVEVSWENVKEFIRHINLKTGKAYRLPTEAEWEYAAQGGKRTRGFTYSGSNNPDEVAWFNENATGFFKRDGARPVGEKKPNELGIYDMSGNVWEWCQDWYDSEYYGKSPSHNPKGPDSGIYRVFRGGSWFSASYRVRLTNRNYGGPDHSRITIGFRLASDL